MTRNSEHPRQIGDFPVHAVSLVAVALDAQHGLSRCRHRAAALAFGCARQVRIEGDNVPDVFVAERHHFDVHDLAVACENTTRTSPAVRNQKLLHLLDQIQVVLASQVGNVAAVGDTVRAMAAKAASGPRQGFAARRIALAGDDGLARHRRALVFIFQAEDDGDAFLEFADIGRQIVDQNLRRSGYNVGFIAAGLGVLHPVQLDFPRGDIGRPVAMMLVQDRADNAFMAAVGP